MRRRTLDLLRCPECGSRVVLRSVASGSEGRVEEGLLGCAECGREYPVSGSVPRFRTSSGSETGPATARRFQVQWRRFQAIERSSKDQFQDWIHPIEEAFLKGKTVLDVGCGMGRFTRCFAEAGAGYVVGLDLGDSVDVAQDLYGNLENVDFVQADIMNMPFGPVFDLASSIGVLHHLPQPRLGFERMVQTVHSRGHVFAWVYGRENNGFIVRFVSPVRRKVTSRIPDRALSALSFVLAAGLHPVLKLLYRPVGRFRALRFLRKILFYYPYLHWLSGYGFRHTQVVIYDHLTAPVAHYIAEDEFRSWFSAAGCSEVVVTPRNRNSWRGLGRVP